MKEIMKIKLAIKKFVGKNEVFIIPVLKFLLTFICLSGISSKIGFMSRLTSKPLMLIIALAGSFLPLNLTLVILGLIIIAHMYALAIECAIIVFALFLVLYLLYFRFASEDSVGGMLTPVTFMLHIPYAMPVAMGLVGNPTSLVAVAAGVVIYEVLNFVSGNADTLTNGGNPGNLGQFKVVADAIIGNKEMIVLVVAFSVTVLVVYLIRRLAIKYAWLIAIGAGEITLLVVTLIANASLHAGISVGSIFLGIILSAIVNVIMCYFCFDLNYNKIEKVQFEDDEYYYYVKAIPKNEFLDKPVKKKKPSSGQPVRQSSGSGSERPSERTSERPVSERTVSERSQSERPVQERKAAPVRQAVQRPRTSSSDEAAAAIRSVSHTANKGPLGLSGGRPAGEGRRLREQAEAQNKKNQ